MNKFWHRWGLAMGILILSMSFIHAQQNLNPNLLRDTLVHKSGLAYKGRITMYNKKGKVRLTDPKGGFVLFQLDDLEYIGWSNRSRIKYAAETIELDSVAFIDIIHLKDGSILKGKILSYDQGNSIRFKIMTGELTIDEPNIDKIVQEPTDPLFNLVLLNQKREKVYSFRERGFYNATVFALMPGGGEFSNELGLSLQTSFGHQFSRHFGLGIGVSIDGYANADLGDTFLPLFAEARGYLFKKIRTPYWVVAGGYGFPLRTNTDGQDVRSFEGGYMFHPAIGYRLGADKSVNLTFDIGYKFQKAFSEREFLFSGDILTRDVLYQRLSMRISVIF